MVSISTVCSKGDSSPRAGTGTEIIQYQDTLVLMDDAFSTELTGKKTFGGRKEGQVWPLSDGGRPVLYYLPFR